MQSRFIKQLIYGILYLAVFAVLGYGLYIFLVEPASSCFDNRKNGSEEDVDCGGPSCVSCELRRLKPIAVTEVSAFDLGSGKVNVLIRFQNSNPGYGAEEFGYTLTLFSEGGEALAALPRTSFLYPGEIKFVVEAGIAVLGSVRRGEVAITNVSWKKRDEFPRPDVEVRDLAVESRSDPHEKAVTGLLGNRSPFFLVRLHVNVAIQGTGGAAVAAAKTVIQDVAPEEEKPFKVIVPAVPLPAVPLSVILVSVEAVR